jgi:hypothetical protein
MRPQWRHRQLPERRWSSSSNSSSSVVVIVAVEAGIAVAGVAM